LKTVREIYPTAADSVIGRFRKYLHLAEVLNARVPFLMEALSDETQLRLAGLLQITREVSVIGQALTIKLTRSILGVLVTHHAPELYLARVADGKVL